MKSILIDDFLHCDLHDGNWKVILPTQTGDTNNTDTNKDTSYKILIYDCGIIGHSGDRKKNRELFTSIIDGDYLRAIESVVSGVKQHPAYPVIQKHVAETIADKTTHASQNFRRIVSLVLELGLHIDEDLVRILHGSIMASGIHQISVDRFVGLLGKDKSNVSLLLHGYKCILERIGQYRDLVEYIQHWLHDIDINSINVFHDWMMEELGHTDEGVFAEIMCKAFGV
jgi:hypothetical protein